MKLFFLIIAFMLTAPGARAQLKGTSAPMRIVINNQAKDASGPRLTIIQPVLAGGQIITVKEPQQRIVVEASDENGISEVLINSKKSDTNDGRRFYANINLKAGENIISISARDARGNTTIRTFNMTWLSTLAPPVISIIAPLPGKGTKVISSQNVISVKGTALSLNGIKQVTINRLNARLTENGTFSADVAIRTGDNALVISATDGRGNTATETFFVTRR